MITISDTADTKSTEINGDYLQTCIEFHKWFWD